MFKRTSKYNQENLSVAVSNSTSLAGVLRHFGLKQSGGNQSAMSQRISNLGIDTSHFTGQAWNKGLTAEDHPSIDAYREKISYKDDEILTINSPQTKTSQLKALMIKYGVSYECMNGHGNTWMGEALTLHIDHINGIRTDNRLGNLRFLCPNCHQQTATWGRRKS